MSVLILAPESDLHTRAVVDEIGDLGGEVRVFDVARFPEQVRLSAHLDCCGRRSFVLIFPNGEFDLGDVGSVWWRRPGRPRISDDIVDRTQRAFAANETQEALGGLWHALDVHWVNDPARDQVAHRKLHQLRSAQELGLRIPDTLITNDPDRARRFIDAHGYRDVIYKAFSALQEEWRETRLLKPEELELLDHVQYAPVIFQEYIPAVYDLRITVVGDRLFPAAIHSQETDYPVDFRMEIENATVEPAELPEGIERGIHRFMEQMGLVYGAIDMRLTPDGDYVFLEINPAGQWLFVEERSGQSITRALAERLVEGDRRADPPEHPGQA